ncbi:MAG TPA: hypothetical protein VER33_19060 [Polyangiaceae bacterium]|nr:hypothetical protein [Polyangiaceae bacterium]
MTLPRVVVFFALTNLGWLIFRETSIDRLAANLALRPGSDSPEQLAAAGYFLGTIVVYALPLCVDTALDLTGVTRQPRQSMRWVVLQGAALGLLIAGMALLYSDVPSDFIYFQF